MIAAHTCRGYDVPMQTVLDASTWESCQDIRQRQHKLGMVCAVFLVVALLGLVDGLQGLMRSGATTLELLPGKSAALSGQLTIKNPVMRDIEVSFTPANVPLTCNLEGFVAGYWFGNGMWRGAVSAENQAEPGEYHMRVAFRGAAASTFQNYMVQVHADANDMRAQSTSFVLRLTGVNPFVLAVGFVGLALLFGVGVYRQGCRLIRMLVRMGCGEIVRVQEEKDGVRLWCLLYGSRPPYEGTVCAVITAEGGVLAHARACTAAKGLLQLFISWPAPEKNESGPECNESGQVQKESGLVPKEKNFAVRPGCLVCLRPPCPQSPPAPTS